jgi:DNA-directed RNA polymerase specialized sigma24 family protein
MLQRESGIWAMASQQPAQEAEALLEQWLGESDRTQARALMDTLVCHHAEPLIRRIVSFKLDSTRNSQDRGNHRADVEDVCSTALYNLLARLERVKGGDNEPAVRNFTGYAAVTAYNACNEYFRAKKPAWVRLSMKLRYLATHEPKFGLWQTVRGQDVCGFGRDNGREANRDIVHLSEACKRLWQSEDPRRLSFSELVEAILAAAGAPLVFDDLVNVVSEWSDVRETRLQSLDEERGEGDQRWELVDEDPPAETRLSARQYMQRLWNEICDLPLEHRRALLLNLEDSAGGDIQLFDFLGIAGIRQIAAAVEMGASAFAELWKRLPLDDASIGRELGISRQDVANRRSSARKRLARKMKEFERGN